MKKPIIFAVLFVMVLASVAAILQSGWTSTTNPGVARTALGVPGLTNNNAFTGSNFISGYIASDTGSGTNTSLTASTNWGSVGRSNYTRMSADGWENTNTSAANQGVRISRGQVVIDGGGTNVTQLSVGTGTNAFVVGTNGNVGIGKTSPGDKLDVAGGIIVSNNYSLQFRDSTGVARPVLLYNSADNIIFKGIAGTDMFFGNANAITLKSSGNTTFGSATSTGSKVGVAGSASIGATYFSIAAPTSGLIIEGNVGIGASNPTSGKLVVAGSITADTDNTGGIGAAGANRFNNIQIGTGASAFAGGLGSSRSNRLAAATITVTASPFNWTNTANVNVAVYIDGISVTGTVGVNGGTVFNSIGQNTIMLQTNEWTTITYTLGNPTATWKPF